MTKRLSREEIERRLLDLKREPELEDLQPGAMCYSPVEPPHHWVYVCPACGKRTAYMMQRDLDQQRETAFLHEPSSDGARTVSMDRIWDMQGLESALSLARKLPKRSGISLDESALCVFCRPEAEDYVPVLEVQLLNDVPRRVRFNSDDVALLRAFLRGEDRYRDDQDCEYSMGGAVSQLRHLLLGEPKPAEDGEE